MRRRRGSATNDEGEAFRDAIAVALDERTRAARDIFRQRAQVLFVRYAQLRSFGWVQGEYYNDEHDVFTARTDEEGMTINGVPFDTAFDDPWGTREARPEHRDIAPLYAACAGLIEGLEKETFRTLFGDGVAVTVDRERGILIETYDGDI